MRTRYKNTQQERSVKVANAFFLILATIFIGLSVFLSLKYIDINKQKNLKAEEYNVKTQELDNLKKENAATKTQHDNLAKEVSNLQETLKKLNGE